MRKVIGSTFASNAPLALRSAAPQLSDIGAVRWHFGFVPILLQKSLMAFANGDSLALTRFAVEASHDGAAQS
jgi:hypothetical protein